MVIRNERKEMPHGKKKQLWKWNVPATHGNHGASGYGWKRTQTGSWGIESGNRRFKRREPALTSRKPTA